MDLPSPRGPLAACAPSDEEVVRRVLAGEVALFELLMRRHNQRLFRTVRALVGDDDAAEEALHRAYVAAWRGLAQFDGRAAFATWMTRIALRTAGELARRERRIHEIAEDAATEIPRALEVEGADTTLSRKELAAVLERAIDALPESLRMVVVLRLVQGLSTAEVAEALDMSEANVKVRLHRARERPQGGPDPRGRARGPVRADVGLRRRALRPHGGARAGLAGTARLQPASCPSSDPLSSATAERSRAGARRSQGCNPTRMAPHERCVPRRIHP